jgi:hypothetical protein
MGSLLVDELRNKKISRARWELDSIRFHLEKTPAPMRSIRSLQELIPEVLPNIDAPVDERVTEIKKRWKEWVGEPIFHQTTVKSIEQNVLIVLVKHSGWISELERIKRVVVQKMNDHFGSKQIQRIQFLLDGSNS